MSNYTIRAKSHSEWLEARRAGIGSSEIGTILGVSPWDTPYKLWLRKTGQVKEEEQENFLMKAGHYLEDAIAHFCADETGCTVIKQSAEEFLVVNRDRPYLRVSPDRYAWLPDRPKRLSNKVIIECKSTQKAIVPEDLPMHWFVQVMYQLGVCELEAAYLAWLTQGRDFGCAPIRFDKDFYRDVILSEIERFWTDYVLGGKEPPLSDVGDVLLKYPRQYDGKSVVASPELVERWQELKETNTEIRRLTKVKEDAEAAIKLALCDAEALVLPGDGEHPQRVLATWKAGTDTAKFDQEALEKCEPEVYGKYLVKTTAPRRFMLKQ